MIKLVGRCMSMEYGPLRVFHGDAYDIHDIPGDGGMVWHDIWPDIGSDNLRGMHYLHQKYRDRCGWQGVWSLEQSMTMQDQERLLVKEVERINGGKITPTHEVWSSYSAFVELEAHYAYFVEEGYHATAPEDLFPERRI